MGAFLFVTTGGVGIDSGISCMETWDAAEHLVMHRTAPQQKIIWPKGQWYQETSQTTFDTFNQLQYLLHTLHKSFFFFCISVVLLPFLKE